MKVIIILHIIFLVCSSCEMRSPNELPEELKGKNYQEIKLPLLSTSTSTSEPDRCPMYINGLDGLMADLYKNLSYPKEEQESGLEGTVILEFVVTELGKVAEIKVIKPVSENIDKVAIEALKKIKTYYPAHKAGTPVRVRYQLPIRFKLS